MNDNEALLILSYGGPEAPGDLEPYLENLLRGRNVPRSRYDEAIRKYETLAEHTGEYSPISQECRSLISGLLDEFDKLGPRIPVYWGNLHWYPMLYDTMLEMVDDGIDRAYVFTTSAFDSPQGNRRYDDAISEACTKIGDNAPRIMRLPLCWNNPMFLSTQTDRLLEGLGRARLEAGFSVESAKFKAKILFTAHSIPVTDAESSPYVEQITRAAGAIAELAHLDEDGFSWDTAWQSRSGSPETPWLEPSLEEAIKKAAAQGMHALIAVPLGFFCENMETAYDLDFEAAARAESLGLVFSRAQCVGAHSKIVRMIRDSLVEKMTATDEL